MGKKLRGPNEKQVAGRAKKAAHAAAQQVAVNRQKETTEAAAWAQGSNQRKSARDEAAALKADQAARKRREKAELLAAEEAATAAIGGSSKVKTTSVSQKGKKKKPKNDLELLKDALQKDADKKVRKRKEDALLKKKQQTKTPEPASTAPTDPLLANTARMIGVVDEEETMVGRQANVASMEVGASGIDAALGSLNMSSSSPPKAATSAKALYAEFEARMLPQVKEYYPGLRLTQYKEKVWGLWKKSPENPANQEPSARANP